jgi:SAM-dependent methyltransferase
VSERPTLLPSSFRDPHGFVFTVGGTIFRQVNDAHRGAYEHMESTGLLEELFRDGLLIPHEEVDVGLAAAPGAYKVLRPDVVPFISYPYEWCFSGLRDAALHTLEVQRVAMSHGMSLRDASAYNIQFVRGRPILIDTLSFEQHVPGRPWVAYRQFCEHFVAPLALMAMRDVRIGRTLQTFLDGVPLDLASSLLPLRSRRVPGLQLHVHLHARSQLKHASKRSQAPGPTQRRFSERSFEGLLSSLESTITRLSSPSGPSAWKNYYSEADHYADEAAAAKETIVRGWLSERRARTVWDLGANTGRFASIAARLGAEVVAFDADPLAVESAYRARRELDAAPLPLVMDLTNPSASVGLAHAERMSLAERGPADLTLALALVHHLAIGANVPLGRFASLLADLGASSIVEWVPKDDPKVEAMLASREDVFESYSESVFVSELERRFAIVGREPIPEMGRVLYLVERR